MFDFVLFASLREKLDLSVVVLRCSDNSRNSNCFGVLLFYSSKSIQYIHAFFYRNYHVFKQCCDLKQGKRYQMMARLGGANFVVIIKIYSGSSGSLWKLAQTLEGTVHQCPLEAIRDSNSWIVGAKILFNSFS